MIIAQFLSPFSFYAKVRTRRSSTRDREIASWDRKLAGLGEDGGGGGRQKRNRVNVILVFGPSANARYLQRAAEGIEKSVQVQGRCHNFAGRSTPPLVKNSVVSSYGLWASHGTFLSLAAQ